MKLRSCQVECVDAIKAAYQRGLKRVLIEAATGFGKAIVFSMIAKMVHEKKGRTLILCNRDVLVKQAAEKLYKAAGMYPGIDKADEHATPMSNVVVGSIQTMQGKRLTRWDPSHFSLVITDEVHYGASKTFRAIFEHFKDAFHLGVSATIERSDKQGLGFFFEEIVYRMPLYSMTEYVVTTSHQEQRFADHKLAIKFLDKLKPEEAATAKVSEIHTKGAVNEGWLCGLKVKEIPVPVVIDEAIANKKNISEEEEAFALEPYIERLIKSVADEVKDRKTLIFFPDCKASAAAAQLLRDLGLEAKHVDSTYMPDNEREGILKWFKTAGRGSVLTNASLLTTGYDQPDIDCIVILRLLKSTPLYKQIVGRGTRTVPEANIDAYSTADERKAAIAMSSKPHCLLLDIMLQNENHSFATPTVLISDLKEDKEKTEGGQRGFPPDSDLNDRRIELEKVRLEEIHDKLKKVAEAAANAAEKKRKRSECYIADILKHQPNGGAATEKQISYAKSLGCKDDLTFCSKSQVSKIIARFIAHKEKMKAYV